MSVKPAVTIVAIEPASAPVITTERVPVVLFWITSVPAPPVTVATLAVAVLKLKMSLSVPPCQLLNPE